MSTWHGYQRLKNRKRRQGKKSEKRGNGNQYAEGQHADI